MRKNQRSLMKRCTVAVVSVSTVLPSIAPAMTVLADELDQDADLDGSSNESVKKSADADQEPDEDVTDKVIKKATKSEADGKTDDELEVDEDGNPEDGDLNDDINASNESKAEEETPDQTLDDITLSGKDFGEYPEFGSEDFVKWLSEASDEEVEEWYAAAVVAKSENKATDSEATPSESDAEVPAFGTDAFWAWLYEDAAEMVDGEWLYDMDAILSWMVKAGYENAYDFIQEFFLKDAELHPLDSYPEFGTAEFWSWFMSANEQDVKAWHASIKKEDTEGATEEQLASYALSLWNEDQSDVSEEFNTWFETNCVIRNEEGEITGYHYDVLLDWICHVDFETAYGFLTMAAEAMMVMPLSIIGSLWPENYGANGNVYSDGNGTKENPYTIDSVEDLRQFAAMIAQNKDTYNNDDVYYRIKNGTYDLNGCWLPVGGALNDGGTPSAFRAHLACDDKVVIENFGTRANTAIGVSADMISKVTMQQHYGFFAKLGAGATVTGLHIQTNGNTVSIGREGGSYVGLIAGEAIDADIKDCYVSGYVTNAYGYTGGIVGYAHSSDTSDTNRGTVIEDCRADEIAVWTSNLAPNGYCEGHSAVGGIVGYAANTSILDTVVDTNAGSGNHIYGNSAFVGGIAGVIKNANVINSQVESGQVGSNESYSVGGLVGGYNGGKVRVGRFSGDVIAPTGGYNYSACFIGSAIRNTTFTYGEYGEVAYLFADTKGKADKGVLGGKPASVSGTYGTDAYIGYWHAGDKGYTLVSGNVDQDSADGDYFYELLENGIQATTRAAGSNSAMDPNLATINHYTCDSSGNPIRGYLLTTDNPIVDGKLASEMTAYVLGNNYRKPATSTHQVAFAEGDVVYVTFDDKKEVNAAGNAVGFYKMNDAVEQNPWYSHKNIDGFLEEEAVSKAGINKSGGYHFSMPAADTTIGAVYKKSSESVEILPNRVVFDVTQIRTGTREQPTIEWRATAYDADPDVSSGTAKIITDGKGNKWENILIASQTQDGKLIVNEAAKFWMTSATNGVENKTFNLNWAFSNNSTVSTDGGNGLIYNLVAGNGNTAAPAAYFMLNLTDAATSAIAKQANLLAEKQIQDGYKNSITTASPYWYHSVVTATAQVEDANDKANPPMGTLDATFKFNIVDQTQVAVQGVALNHNNITYNVVRTLSGDRKNPEVKYTVNGESDAADGSVSDLIATFNPDYFSKDDVSWYITKTGLEEDFNTIKGQVVENAIGNVDDGTLNVSTSANSYKNAYVNLKGISEKSADGNVTIAAWAGDEDAKYTARMIKNPGDAHQYQMLVKVTAKDASKNTVTDTCLVTVNFQTEDRTEIMPTEVKINDKSKIQDYNIFYTFKGDRNSEITKRTISYAGGKQEYLTDGIGEKLSATVTSYGEEYDSSNSNYQPYENGVIWSIGRVNAGDSLDVNDVLRIDQETGQITVRGFDDSTDVNADGYSPWVQSLIAANKLNGRTVTVRVYATSKKDHSVYDYRDINITFKASTAFSEQQDGMTFDIVETKNVAKTVDGTSVVEKSTWTGIDKQEFSAALSGVDAAPSVSIQDENGNVVNAGSAIKWESTPQYDPDNKQTFAYLTVNTDSQWFSAIRNSRGTDNKGTKQFKIVVESANADSRLEIPVTVNYRYDGLDMTAEQLRTLPAGFEATPDHYDVDTPAETYDVSKGTVNDRDINLKVVVTQGSKSENVEATKKWSYGIVKLGNTYYSENGVAANQGTYELTGEIANFAKIDENGYLVPIKGTWEDLIAANKTKGQKTGMVTCYKQEAGKSRVEDSYKVTIDFRYDMAYIDQHEKTFNVVYTDNSFTNDKKNNWTGDQTTDPFKLTAHFTNEFGTSVTPDYEYDQDILGIDADGNVTLKREWMQKIIDNAKDFGSGVFTGQKQVTVTARGNNGTTDTCVITINFRYDQARLNSNTEEYTIIRTQTSRTNNPSHTWSELKDGTVKDIASRKLQASMHLADGAQTTAYWSSENEAYVTVNDDGVIMPAVDQAWQDAVIANGKYKDSRTAAINVTNIDETVKDSCNVTVNYIYEDVELEKNTAVMNVNLKATGLRDNATYAISGHTLNNPATIHSHDAAETEIVYEVEGDAASFLEVDANGRISLKLPKDGNGDLLTGSNFKTGASKFIQDAMTHPYTQDGQFVSTTTATVIARSADGRMADQCNLTINLTYEDMQMDEKEQTLDVTISALNREQKLYDISKFDGQVAFSNHSTDPNDTVSFTSSRPDILKVNADGSYALVVPDYATTGWKGETFLAARNDFLKQAMLDENAGKPQSVDVVITATTKYSGMQDSMIVHVNLTYRAVTLDKHEARMSVTMNANGSANDPTYSFTGDLELDLRSTINDPNLDNTTAKYTSENPDILTVDENTGKVTFTQPRNLTSKEFKAELEQGGKKYEFIKEALQYPYQADKTDSLRTRDVVIKVTDNSGHEDQCTVHVTLMYQNLTVANKEVSADYVLRTKDLAKGVYEVIGNPVSAAANLHSPTLTTIEYESSDPSLATVDKNGMVSVVVPKDSNGKLLTGDAFKNAANEMFTSAMQHPYDLKDDDPADVTTRQVTITAKAKNASGDVVMTDTTTVTFNTIFEKMELAEDIQELNVNVKATNLTKRVYDITGYTGQMGYKVNSKTDKNTTAKFELVNPEDAKIITLNSDGTYSLNIPDRETTQWTGEAFENALSDWMKEAMKHPTSSANPHVTTAKIPIRAVSEYDGLSDSAYIQVNFTYEQVEMTDHEMDMNITLKATGNADDPTYQLTGTSASLRGIISAGSIDNKTVSFTSGDENILKVDAAGNVTFNSPYYMDHEHFVEQASDFIKDAMKRPYMPGTDEYVHEKDILITVTDQSGQMTDECTVHVKLTFENLTMKKKNVAMDLTLRAEDLEGKKFSVLGDSVSAAANLNVNGGGKLKYSVVGRNDLVSVDEDGNVSIVLPDSMEGDDFLNNANEQLKDVMNHPYNPNDDDPQDIISREVTIKAENEDGTMYDTCTVKVNLLYEKMQLSPDVQELNVKIKATNREKRVYEITGYTGKMDYSIFSKYPDNDTATFSLATASDAQILNLNSDGSYSLIVPDKDATNWTGDAFNAQATAFLKEAMSHPSTPEHPYTTTKDITLNAVSEYNDMRDSAIVRINVTYEEVELDTHEADMDIKLKATGYADDPVYELTGTNLDLSSIIHSADLNNKNVTFKSSDESILKVDNKGKVTFNMPYYMDQKQFMEQASDFIKDAMKRPYMPGTDEYRHEADVVITVYDESGQLADQCTVHVKLTYENLVAKQKEVTMKLKLRAKNLARKEFEVVGDPVSTAVNVNSDVYKKAVYTSSDKNLLTVDENGQAYITLPATMSGDGFVNNINGFLKDAMLHPYDKSAPYTSTTSATVTAATEDGTMKDTITVNFELIYENTDITDSARTMDVTITGTGSSGNPTYTLSGNTAALTTKLYNTTADEHGPLYSSSDPGILAVDNAGKLTLVAPANLQGSAFSDYLNAFLKDVLAHPYTTANPYVATKVVTIKATNGEGDLADETPVTIRVKYVNNTSSYSGGGGHSGGGGGGGGGSHSSGGGGGKVTTGVGPSGSKTTTSSSLPTYVVSGGTWALNAAGKWIYTNGRTYTDEWAAVHNPYADTSKGQKEFDWFHFGKDSTMTTGWYTEADGNTYYLSPISDGTQGHMLTGWNWIDDNGDGIYEYYYFETESNGTRGKLYKNTNVGGYMVNGKGQYVDGNGRVVTKTAAEVAAATKAANVPSYVIQDGTWQKDAQGRWTFATTRQFKNEWAAVYNPYADTAKGQRAYDWFYFGADGVMKTGWFTDSNGDTYYLNPLSDGTLGRMLTGWNWIDADGDGKRECYYFETESNGKRGKLYKNTTINGFKVNAKGQWVDNSGNVRYQ